MLPGSHWQSSGEGGHALTQIEDATDIKVVCNNCQNKSEMVSSVEWSLPPVEIKEGWSVCFGIYTIGNGL